jgi:hypothetical protein
MVLGPGIISCGTWTGEDPIPLSHYQHQAWVLGFVTGFNFFGLQSDKDVSLGTDNEGITRWITQYCADHPLDTVAKAAVNLVAELQRRTGAR